MINHVSVFPSDFFEHIFSEEGSIFLADIICWGAWHNILSPSTPSKDDLTAVCNQLFMSYPEFRSLLDYRCPRFRGYQKEVYKRATELYLKCDEIGPRFRIQHGQNTYIFARQIGSDFFVNHNVTIGSNRGIPCIGNRVSIRTGAVVVGPICIGHGSRINANAVVSQDMPENCIAYAPKTQFVVNPTR